jgi:Ca-activated chloride channel family protein
MTSRKSQIANPKSPNRRLLIVVVAALVIAALVCCLVWGVTQLGKLRAQATVTPEAVSVADPREATLRVAYSPEKAALFTELVEAFNKQKLRTPDRRTIRVQAEQQDVEAMLEAALAGAYEAISPDSSLWLDQLDRAWAEQTGSEAPLVGESHRYGVSPVVLAMWEPVARDLGWPDQPIGWSDVQAKAQQDPNFKWSHPSTSSASGLLATLAEFYAGAGKTRGLTIEDAQAQATLDYVGAVERTVRYYGEGELAVIERAQQEGPDYLDAFVVQEQLVVQFNRQARGNQRLVAVYPAEGTLWEDHPLALLETPTLTTNQRLTFQHLREFLSSEEAQATVLAHGYRPADLTIPLDSPDYSPLTAANGVDSRQPQTTLQMPSPAVVDVVRNVWWYTKRHTNVYLVVDTSGSMEGEKLEAAREALSVFLSQIEGDLERVGMVEFSTQVNNIIPLNELRHNRAELEDAVSELYAAGDTALLDGVRAAYVRLQQANNVERINAIVAMTDGRENASGISLRQLAREIEWGNDTGVPVVIFCIAYGRDADYNVLDTLAEASGGQVRQGDLETIRELYKILSTYF